VILSQNLTPCFDGLRSIQTRNAELVLGPFERLQFDWVDSAIPTDVVPRNTGPVKLKSCPFLVRDDQESHVRGSFLKGEHARYANHRFVSRKALFLARSMWIFPPGGLADALGVTAVQIDRYARDGMPVERRGRKGVAYSFDLAACIRWLRARDAARSLAPPLPESPREPRASREERREVLGSLWLPRECLVPWSHRFIERLDVWESKRGLPALAR